MKAKTCKLFKNQKLSGGVTRNIYSVMIEGKVVYTSSPTHKEYYAILMYKTTKGDWVADYRFGRPDLVGKGSSKYAYQKWLEGDQDRILAKIDHHEVQDLGSEFPASNDEIIDFAQAPDQGNLVDIIPFKEARWIPSVVPYGEKNRRLGHLHLIDQLDRLFILDIYGSTFWVDHGEARVLTFSRFLLSWIVQTQEEALQKTSLEGFLKEAELVA